MFERYHWFFAIIFLSSLDIIQCESEPFGRYNTACLERYEYDNDGNTSFAFRLNHFFVVYQCGFFVCESIAQLSYLYIRNRYNFEDGSVVSGRGVLFNANERLQNGSFEFNLRGKAFKFNYDIDEDSADHGILSKFE